jgi:acetoacetyl-CoA synthetase
LPRGVTAGDRVGAIVNMPEAVIGMLAASSLGAVWSSCSPDFGVQGILDRFGQIEPKVLIAVDGYHYNGKTLNILDKVAEVSTRIPSVERVVVVPYVQPQASLASVNGGVGWAEFLAPFAAGEVTFTRLPFNHPLYILYSSGTTGVPKCIVHGAGGTLLQHLKEHQLHCDLRDGDRLFYFTTCGWMMWNWLVSGLASGATLLLYDGSPFMQGGKVLWELAQAERMTHFGTSAKYIDALKSQARSARSYDRPQYTLLIDRFAAGAGSFDYVYEAIKTDLRVTTSEAPISSPASSAGRRLFRCGAARFNASCWAWRSGVRRR